MATGGSFGQLVISTLVQGRIPAKRVAFIELAGRNLRRVVADGLSIVPQAGPCAGAKTAIDPTGHVDTYLQLQKGGPNLDHKRPDV